MKSWPHDGKPVTFDQITDPLIALAKMVGVKSGKFKPIQPGAYRGLPLGLSEAVVSFGPEEVLSAKRLENAERLANPPPDPLATIITIAVQLGIEQGRRIVKSDESYWLIERAKRSGLLKPKKRKG